MGYQINLPPRYVQPMATNDRLGLEEIDVIRKMDENNKTSCTKKNVEFNLDINQIHSIHAFPKSTTWYDGADYACFAEENNIAKNRAALSERRLKKGPSAYSSLMRVSPGPNERVLTMEDFHMMEIEPTVYRKNLIQSILMHQAQCRIKGYTDPEGYSFLSRALSKADRNQAWRTAAVNAYEVQTFQAIPTSMEPPNLMELLSDYYLDSVYPFLTTPMVFMSKLLFCECD